MTARNLAISDWEWKLVLGEVSAHPSGERKRPVSLGPDETPNRKASVT